MRYNLHEIRTMHQYLKPQTGQHSMCTQQAQRGVIFPKKASIFAYFQARAVPFGVRILLARIAPQKDQDVISNICLSPHVTRKNKKVMKIWKYANFVKFDAFLGFSSKFVFWIDMGPSAFGKKLLKSAVFVRKILWPFSFTPLPFLSLQKAENLGAKGRALSGQMFFKK